MWELEEGRSRPELDTASPAADIGFAAARMLAGAGRRCRTVAAEVDILGIGS